MKEITVKVHVFPEKLKALMRARNMSAARISEDGIYSEKTIRRGIRSGVMTPDLVSYLGYRLSTDPKNFANVDGYILDLKRFLYNWELFKKENVQ